MTQGKWKKGQSGNPKGRPKGSRNSSSPQARLQKALDNGHDIVSLKELAIDLIQDENSKFSPAQIERMLKTLFDVEIALMKMDFSKNGDNSSGSDDEDDDQAGAEFSTTAS